MKADKKEEAQPFDVKPTENICPVGCMAFRFKERIAELEAENERLRGQIMREHFTASSPGQTSLPE